MRRARRPRLCKWLPLGVAFVLAGCGQGAQPQIDGTSAETCRESLDAMEAQHGRSDREAVERVLIGRGLYLGGATRTARDVAFILGCRDLDGQTARVILSRPTADQAVTH